MSFPVAGSHGSNVALPQTSDLMLVDDTTIRASALAEYKSVHVALQREENRLALHYDRDVPAFRTWLNKELGSLLSRIRELGDRHRDNAELHAEILRERERKGGSYHAAWQRVKARREAGVAEPNDYIRQRWREHVENNPATNRDDDTFSQDNPSSSEDNEWRNLSDSAFEEVATTFLSVATAMDHAAGEESGHLVMAQNLVHKERERRRNRTKLKDYYRRLARKLHPDTGTLDSTDEDARRLLWVEVQAAYRDGNVAELELLWLKVNHPGRHFGTHAPISVLKDAANQARSELEAVQAQLRAAECEPAWEFCNQDPKARNAIKRIMRKKLSDSAEQIRSATEELKSVLQRWISPRKSAGQETQTSATSLQFQFELW